MALSTQRKNGSSLCSKRLPHTALWTSSFVLVTVSRMTLSGTCRQRKEKGKEILKKVGYLCSRLCRFGLWASFSMSELYSEHLFIHAVICSPVCSLPEPEVTVTLCRNLDMQLHNCFILLWCALFLFCFFEWPAVHWVAEVSINCEQQQLFIWIKSLYLPYWQHSG